MNLGISQASGKNGEERAEVLTDLPDLILDQNDLFHSFVIFKAGKNVYL